MPFVPVDRIFRASIAAIALLAISPAFGQSPLRVRGSITAIDDGSITVTEQVGGAVRLSTGPATTYAGVIQSSLDAIGVGSFIGSAVKGPRDHLAAVEIVLVPETMRAGRVGYYPWDPLPDTSGINSSGMTDTIMTNGTVTSNCADSAGRVLTVNLVGDKTALISVSPRAPIVQFVPSDRSALSIGSEVVVWTKPDNEARLVAIGLGVAPPM